MDKSSSNISKRENIPKKPRRSMQRSDAGISVRPGKTGSSARSEKAAVSVNSGKTGKSGRTHMLLILAETAAAIFILAAVILTSGRHIRDDITLAELETAVFSELGEGNAFSPRDAMALRKYYGLDASEMEGFCLCLPSSNMDAAELLIVVMKDQSQTEIVKNAMETRLKNQIGVFESYGVDQMRLLDQAEIITEGRYAVFICAENSAKAGAALRRLLLAL